MPRARRQPDSMTLHHDESGVALVWVALFILIVFGLIGLAIDGGRLFNLNTDLQHIADAAALAGAAELDGADGARERAIKAATTSLTKNSPHQAWSNIPDDALQIETTGPDKPSFYWYDATEVNSASRLKEATSDREATYIKVTTIQRGLTTTFLRSIVEDDKAFTSAHAIAKSEYSVCQPLQSFLCNPWEMDQSKRGSASNWKDKVRPGYMFKLAGGSVSGPGSWGLIDPNDPEDKSVWALAKFWAALNPPACVSRDAGLGGREDEVLTGKVSSFAQEGMNVRFDFKMTSDNPHKSSSLEVSAPVVIKGMTRSGGSCSPPSSAVPKVGENCSFPSAFPSSTIATADAYSSAYRAYCGARCNEHSGCQATGTTNPSCTEFTTGTGRIGSCPLPRDASLKEVNNAWSTFTMGTGPRLDDLKAYWDNQHRTTPWPWPAGVVPTRYEIYKYEVDHLHTPGFFYDVAKEDPAPSCTAVGEVDRRVINVGIVDCDYWEVQGTSHPLPAFTTVAKFFLTEPADSNGELYAEYITSLEAQDGGAIYRTVKLVE